MYLVPLPRACLIHWLGPSLPIFFFKQKLMGALSGSLSRSGMYWSWVHGCRITSSKLLG
eukprot:SAG31_NODE_161_length_21899_cov_16.832844_17_plen_59_part_00